MIRRFSTNLAQQAVSRPRFASSPVKTYVRPVAAKIALTSTAPASAGTPNTNPSQAKTLASAAPSTQAFKPPSPPAAPADQSTRSIPELKLGCSPTPGSATTDPGKVVQNLPELEQGEGLGEDWTTSFQGLGSRPFEPRVVDILMAPVVAEDVEVTPDGLIYLPEIKYRRILNRAFGPGGWGIAPRTKTLVTQRQVTREYGLVCLGRLVSVSRGEMDFFNAEGVTTAMEGCKSNALMRCCKDLGIASELWDPSFIRQFKVKHAESKYFEKKRRFVWKRKDRPWEYPYNQ